MQAGVIRLTRKHIPNAKKFSAITVFGTNQHKDFLEEFDHTRKMDVDLLGGIKPTFYPISETKRKSELFIEFLNTLFFIPSLFLLALLLLKVPAHLLRHFTFGKTRKTFDTFIDADFIIWNGRNFRSRRNHLLEIYRTLHVTYHSQLAQALSKPMVCLGASIWELSSPVSKKILKRSLDYCMFVSVREKNSYKAAKSLLAPTTNLRLLPDLSFAVLNKKTHQGTSLLSTASLPQKVGLTIMDWKSDGTIIRENYKKAIIETLRFLIENGASITVIPQVTKKWEHFNALLNEIKSELGDVSKNNLFIIQGEPYIEELLSIYTKLDFLIATRMHSAIFASSVKTPLVAIAYDRGGKWSILEELGYKNYIIPYTRVSSRLLIERITSFWQKKESLLDEININLEKHLVDVSLNLGFSSEILED